MISLVKKDLILAGPWQYLLVASVIALMYNMPDILFIITLISIMITSFFYDHYYKLNRYVQSLPISPNKIVISRYVSAFFIAFAILSFQYIVIRIITFYQSSVYLYTLIDIFILICLATIFIAVVIPIYHFFKSFYIASIIFLGLMIFATNIFLKLSTELIIEESDDPDILWTATSESMSILETIKTYITIDNYGIVGLSIGSLLGFSILLSQFIYKRKNIA